MSLSVSNLLISIGVAYDAQLKAADNLFFSAAVDIEDPTRPMFGGTVGDTNGNPVTFNSGTAYNTTEAMGYKSLNNGIDGDPITIRQIATADGPRYQITDGAGKEIMVHDPTLGGTEPWATMPRYVVKSDGTIYDLLTHSAAGGTGYWKICDKATLNGGTGKIYPIPPTITLADYVRPVGRITFKAKEGATVARAQDELQRLTGIVQLLTRLLEGIQDESRGFNSIIR